VSLRLVQVTAKAGYTDTLRAIAEQAPVVDYRLRPEEEGMRTIFMLVAPRERQGLLDRIQSCLGGDKDWRILVLPVEAALPLPEQPPEAQALLAQAATAQTREELYTEIVKGASLDLNYLLLVFLSTVVAAVGLIEDSIAVVIGGMVIAPLLGPNLAMILATALGDRWLLGRAIAANAAGIGLSIALGLVIAWGIPVEPITGELAVRTEVGLGGIAIALASGAAAALSVTTGVSAALVGVMVAVALLPPAAALGLMLGLGRFDLASGAALLLAVNIVCINLAGQIVFLAKGVKPRTWLEKKSAEQSVLVSLAIWIAWLAVLSFVIYLRTG